MRQIIIKIIMKKMGTLYKLSGVVKEVKPANGKTFSYKEMQDVVSEGMTHLEKAQGVMVEIVPLPSGKSMICNEEGKLMSLPKNEKATEMWKVEYPIAEYPGNNDELIVGACLVVGESELEQ